MLQRPAEKTVRRALKLAGYDLVRRHFYSPIPVVDELPQGLWDGPSEMPGMDLRLAEALAFLGDPLAPHLSEFDGAAFSRQNDSYGPVDAEILYAMVRHYKPARVFELGSGASSHVIHAAALVNGGENAPLQHTVFDPFPFQASPMGDVPDVIAHAIRSEDLAPEQFAALEERDILFVDTTHTVRTGGDVVHIFLQILPRLAQGVIVHVHDIFLPYEYPRDWVVERRRAWAEQYLLQAFLAFNTTFEVLMPNYAIARSAPDTLAQLVPTFGPAVRPGGFWLSRR
jgi:hypothetical protein